ncbi:DUF262 domain-containing protein [Yersinia ruckeri]|jgi:uncharacterized protein with ParB-like and HNH nuclease domain|uniref:DUF262 domain-containing protein n=1 Tax=Yersinia ruckeri TaxID=29486 RepID=UPI002237DE53|nr:DUF262 domain-containing HNH endonuclease family protein [Yersinia ruckeri]MCW6541752.1 DUF262 domain-containing HNH endonuclease family protein [Yersinia ruckeri]MCW6590134.1 DUF262 domain-containing HNH endonuclease family protein [Yersinia ruckeri]UZX92173.1 DUF262 domain-containing HNH endonuclease family protein [Yersinia ruckeri]
MEIKDVFGAQPKSVWEYLCENGQGLYVPAYQRQYSWDKSKITRLIEDICHGFTMLTNREDAITFLGTIIAIHDTNLVTVDPIVKGDVPSRVMTIIDGQQRLTTLILVNTVLHEEIKIRTIKQRNKDTDADTWLLEECMKVLGRLAKTFEENMTYGEGDFQYYPRMIRAYDDSWSRKKDKASYKSAIGNYLHFYGKYGREEQPKKGFKYDPPDNEEQDNSKYKPLTEGRKTVYALIRNIYRDNDSSAKPNQKNEQQDLELPGIDEVLKSEKFQNILLKTEFPDFVNEKLSKKEDISFEELTRLVLFANFVLDRVAITIVTARNEDYAFDMFESLNTTGEPLTAFETFKPKIINVEKQSGYESSQSHQFVKIIENYLESTGKSNEKQEATSKLIVAFALAENGEKLSKRLSEQRRFLKDNFEKMCLEQQREFVRHLSHAALFMQHTWPDDKKQTSVINFTGEAHTESVILCIDLLRKFSHIITLGPLIRFYSEIRRAPSEQRAKAISDFIEAVKAITAFSVLWRSSRRSTENLDAFYRKLMAQGYPSIGLGPLARTSLNMQDSCSLDINLLKKAFILILEHDGKVGTKEEWVKAVSKIPAYTNQKEITRFILLAAAHDSVEDKNIAGLTVAGREGILPMLDIKNWNGDQAQTIEHIAPQEKSSAGWLDSIYDEPELVNRLGNLTLLPTRENSSLKNGSWAKKKLFYKVLSASTSDELDPLYEQAQEQGINVSQSTNNLLAESKYLPLVKAVSTVEGDWTTDLIEKRTVRIAELAWERIHSWLEV